MPNLLRAGFTLALVCVFAPPGGAQTVPQSGFRWRMLGPFRAGRVTAVAGVPGDPNTFYFGTPGGGIWKTGDAGRVWHPISDAVRVPSIGALAVAPSNANILYAGTGEQTPGNGVYKSTDAGATWTFAGLPTTRYIQAIVVDPRNPDTVVVGANSLGFGILWRPYPATAKTDDRGIFKTTDGGKTWTKVLTRDDTLGVVDLCPDPRNPNTLYAVLFHPASGTGDNAVAATSEIVRSTDAGSTWKPLAAKGLPEKDRGRMGIAVAPGSQGRRLYAVLTQGFYRSDDAGASWYRSTTDPRVTGSLYFSRIFADPKNPGLLYVAQTSLYRSTDGGKTFAAYVGAPSGDDFHVLWIDPSNPSRMLLGIDQGALVSLDAGQTWSSWFNQPTAQFYHVATDNAFPYRVYGAQQDSGTASVVSRSDYGEITFRDWMPIGGFEYALIAPDPLHPDIVYSGGWYGTIVRFDRKTGQTRTVFERGTKYRSSSMPPLSFSPQDPAMLYLGMQSVLKSGDGGITWKSISPDLTGYVEKNQDDAKPDPDQPRPAAIPALSLSPVRSGVIWAGTTDRIVQLTRDDGASWQNVTPPGLEAPGEILTLDASHHDAASAYIAVGPTRTSAAPYIARTQDYGRTWRKIVSGLPPLEKARAVREDPVRKGLLYCGTDTGVFVSFDDGERWQPLQLNLPATPVTDLEVHENDLVISTFGRSFWILDDVSPLRQITPELSQAAAHFFEPAPAVRVRWDQNQDTPYPPETPAGENPPDGAILYYGLAAPARGEIALVIRDAQGRLVRRFSNRDRAPQLPPANAPEYWFAPFETLPAAAGLNRFVWDLRYPPPRVLPYGYDGELLKYTEYTLADHAVPGHTPRQQPQGPLVVPGAYMLDLTVGGRTYSQPLTVKLDPRLHVTQADLEDQFELEQQVIRGLSATYTLYEQVAAAHTALTERQKSLGVAEPAKTEAEALEKKIKALENGPRTAPGFGSIHRDLTRLLSSVAGSDDRPAPQVRSVVDEQCKALDQAIATWRALNEHELASFKLPTVTVWHSACSPVPK